MISWLMLELVSDIHLHCASLIASVVHGQVLEQWPNMFRILGLFRQYLFVSLYRCAESFLTVANREQPTELSGDANSTPPTEEGSCLVRIPIDELQTATPTSSS